MDTTIEEKRFANILKEISNNLQQARDDNHHPKNLSMKIIQDRVESTIEPVIDGEYRHKN